MLEVMTSDNSLSLILRRLDEIERKLDDVLQELRTPQHGRCHRLFGAPRQSPEEGMKEGISPGYAAALVEPGPKEQIFGADEPRTGGKTTKKHSALRDAAGRQGPNSTSICSANLPRPINGWGFFPSMAAMNKCLALINKSSDVGIATKKRTGACAGNGRAVL